LKKGDTEDAMQEYELFHSDDDQFEGLPYINNENSDLEPLDEAPTITSSYNPRLVYNDTNESYQIGLTSNAIGVNPQDSSESISKESSNPSIEIITDIESKFGSKIVFRTLQYKNNLLKPKRRSKTKVDENINPKKKKVNQEARELKASELHNLHRNISTVLYERFPVDFDKLQEYKLHGVIAFTEHITKFKCGCNVKVCSIYVPESSCSSLEAILKEISNTKKKYGNLVINAA